VGSRLVETEVYTAAMHLVRIGRLGYGTGRQRMAPCATRNAHKKNDITFNSLLPTNSTGGSTFKPGGVNRIHTFAAYVQLSVHGLLSRRGRDGRRRETSSPTRSPRPTRTHRSQRREGDIG
jgi:hypothetical protein